MRFDKHKKYYLFLWTPEPVGRIMLERHSAISPNTCVKTLQRTSDMKSTTGSSALHCTFHFSCESCSTSSLDNAALSVFFQFDTIFIFSCKEFRQGYILTNLINMSVKFFSTVFIVFFPVYFKSARYHSRFCIFN